MKSLVKAYTCNNIYFHQDRTSKHAPFATSVTRLKRKICPDVLSKKAGLGWLVSTDSCISLAISTILLPPEIFPKRVPNLIIKLAMQWINFYFRKTF